MVGGAHVTLCRNLDPVFCLRACERRRRARAPAPQDFDQLETRSQKPETRDRVRRRSMAGAVESAPEVNVPDRMNAATIFVDRNVAEGRGDKAAIFCGDREVTYAQVLENTNRVGNALRRLDVRIENRVVLLLLDTPEFAYSFF